MARLTTAEAARQLSISRTTLYKLIDQGTLSATSDGLIDQTELLRVAGQSESRHAGISCLGNGPREPDGYRR